MWNIWICQSFKYHADVSGYIYTGTRKSIPNTKSWPRSQQKAMIAEPSNPKPRQVISGRVSLTPNICNRLVKNCVRYWLLLLATQPKQVWDWFDHSPMVLTLKLSIRCRHKYSHRKQQKKIVCIGYWYWYNVMPWFWENQFALVGMWLAGPQVLQRITLE